MLSRFTIFDQSLEAIIKPKVLIGTINAHSYNTVHTDENFKRALLNCDVLLPDGVSVVLALRLLTGAKVKKIAGADLFKYEMKRINEKGGRCFFLGSSEPILDLIVKKAAVEYPNVCVSTLSPSYCNEFSQTETDKMIMAVNDFKPDVLFVGMTAPKQEKWAYDNFKNLEVGHVCCIGAVFDFYAGTVKRAPKLLICLGLEWFYRLIKEPRRLWQRYLIGNAVFISKIFSEKLQGSSLSVPSNLRSLERAIE